MDKCQFTLGLPIFRYFVLKYLFIPMIVVPYSTHFGTKINQRPLFGIIMKIKLILLSKQRFEINIDNQSMLSPAEQVKNFMVEKDINYEDLDALEYENARINNLDYFDDWCKKMEDLTNHNMRQCKELMEDEPFDIRPTNAQQALSEFYSNYPRNRIWQLAVDGQLYTQITGNSKEQIIKKTDNKGWFHYENRERGSLKAFFWGINISLEHIEEKKISLDLINNIHFCVTNAVHGLEGEIIRGGYRNTEVNLNLYTDTGRVTIEGLEDLLNKIERRELGSAVLFLGSTDTKEKEDKFYINQENISEIKSQLLEEQKITTKDNLALAVHLISKFSRFKYQAPEYSEIGELTEQTIEHYNQNLSRVSTPEETLELIGKTIESFQRIHPYGDANGRVFVNLLQNRLLIQHGFPPATFFQPNLYDIYGHHVAVLKRGILNTIIIYNSGNPFGYYMHKENSTNEQAFFLEMDELNRFKAQFFTNPLFALLSTVDYSNIGENDILKLLSFTDDLLLKLDCIDEILDHLDPEQYELINRIHKVYKQLVQNVPSPQYNQTTSDFVLQELNIQIEKRVRTHNALMEILIDSDEEMERELTEDDPLSKENFIADLNNYIEYQSKEASGRISTGLFWESEEQLNIEAAQKLIKLLKGEELQEPLTPMNMKALNSAKLGEITTKYRSLYEMIASDISNKIRQMM
jgi:hypothetical protein